MDVLQQHGVVAQSGGFIVRIQAVRVGIGAGVPAEAITQFKHSLRQRTSQCMMHAEQMKRAIPAARTERVRADHALVHVGNLLHEESHRMAATT